MTTGVDAERETEKWLKECDLRFLLENEEFKASKFTKENLKYIDEIDIDELCITWKMKYVQIERFKTALKQLKHDDNLASKTKTDKTNKKQSTEKNKTRSYSTINKTMGWTSGKPGLGGRTNSNSRLEEKDVDVDLAEYSSTFDKNIVPATKKIKFKAEV